VINIRIKDRPPVHVRCECTNEANVADLEAAVHWAFLEALRHGRGCSLDIAVDITLHIENVHAQAVPSGPT